jgi:hypothetical protein
MGGTLEITETLCWMPARWVFDNAMEGLASHAAGEDPALARELLDARTSVSGGYLDVRLADRSRFAILARATADYIAETEYAGAEAFNLPAFYPGFVAQLKSLHSMLVTAEQGIGD